MNSTYHDALVEMRRALENAIRCAQVAARSAPNAAKRDAVATVAAFHVVDALEHLSAVEAMAAEEAPVEVEQRTGLGLEIGEGVVLRSATRGAAEATRLSQLFSGNGDSIVGRS